MQCGEESKHLIGGARKSLLVRGFSRAHGMLLLLLLIEISMSFAVADMVALPSLTATR